MHRWRFQQCFGTFNMLLGEGSSETGHFRRLSHHVLGVRNFGNTKSTRVFFLFKIFIIYCRFQKSKKKLRKIFCFLYYCILICIVKLYLWRTGLFSLAGNVLTSSPKIWHVKNRNFFRLNWLGSCQWIG